MAFDLAEVKKSSTKEHFKDFEYFIKRCPKDILKHMNLKRFNQGDIIMSAGQHLSHVYILIEGVTNIIDENVPTMPFSFQQLRGVDMLGDYEVFTNTLQTIVTISALSDLVCIELSVETYRNWMQKDIHALFIRTSNLVKVLAPQTQFHRQFLFVDNETKFILFLVSRIESAGLLFPHVIKDSKHDLTSFIGCSERTINRILVSLEQQDLISRTHGKIIVCESQYYFLKYYLQESEDSLKLTIPR